MKTSRITLAALLLAFPSIAQILRADTAPSRPPPIDKGQRVFTIGHSFHVWIAPLLKDIATKAGIADHAIAGVSSIGGSRVVQHWDLPAEKNNAKKILSAGGADVLTIAPIWLPDEGIENFARLAVSANPDIRIFVQEYWLPNDTYNPVYPLEVRKYVDHNATDLAELRRQNDRYRADIENHIRELNKRLGKNALYVVPVGEASIRLREKIAAGKARPLRVQWSLFSDSWGHPTAPLRVLAAYCYYAAIYRRSPVGLPMPAVLEKNTDLSSPGLNRLLQEIAWETVSTSPLTGLGEKAK